MTTEQEAVPMNAHREILLLTATIVVIVLFCFASVGWDVISGLIFNIDGLLLVASSLSLVTVFGFVLVLQAKSAGWFSRSKKPDAPEKSPAASAK